MYLSCSLLVCLCASFHGGVALHCFFPGCAIDGVPCAVGKLWWEKGVGRRGEGALCTFVE